MPRDEPTGLLDRLAISPAPFAHHDFALAWAGRFLVILAFVVAQSYALYLLQDRLRQEGPFPNATPEQGLAILTAAFAVASMATSLLGGLLSDRLARRKVFVAVGD